VYLNPVNPTAGDFKRPSKSRVYEFKQIFSEAGVNCTIRIEKGTEISAACGQLSTDTVGRVRYFPIVVLYSVLTLRIS